MAFATKAILTSIPEERAAKEGQKGLVPIMVAAKDLLPGEELNPQNVRFDRFPENVVTQDIITHYRDAAGRTVKQAVKKGAMISLYNLNDSPEGSSPKSTAYVTPGNHYVSFLIDKISEDETPAAGFEALENVRKSVRPEEDRAEISVSLEEEGEKDPETGKPLPRTLVTRSLFDNVDIHQVKTRQRVIDNEGTIETVLLFTFILSDEQLNVINEAAGKGRLTITVKDPDSDKSGGIPLLLRGISKEEPTPPPQTSIPPDETSFKESLLNYEADADPEKASPFDFSPAPKQEEEYHVARPVQNVPASDPDADEVEEKESILTSAIVPPLPVEPENGSVSEKEETNDLSESESESAEPSDRGSRTVETPSEEPTDYRPADITTTFATKKVKVKGVPRMAAPTKSNRSWEDPDDFTGAAIAVAGGDGQTSPFRTRTPLPEKTPDPLPHPTMAE